MRQFDQGVQALETELNRAKTEIRDLLDIVEQKDQRIAGLETENQNLEMIRNDILQSIQVNVVPQNKTMRPDPMNRSHSASGF